MKIRNEPIPLPNTRKALLGQLLKEHFFDIVICSFYVFVFSFPLFFWLIYINLTSFVNITPDNYLLNSLVIYLPIVLGIMILGLGIGGSLYYMKKLVFQEGSNVHQDFFKGIRETFKQSLLSFFVVGLFYALLHIGKNTLLYGSDLNSTVIGILLGLMYFVFFILVIISSFVLTQSILYNATQGQLITNSIRFLIGKALTNILIFIILILPFVLYEFIPINVLHWIIFGVVAIWHFGFNSMIFTLYSHHLFDLSINKEYPEIYRKGLRKE